MTVHFSNCDESEVRRDAYGHVYCALCGCIVHHEHRAATSNEGSECGSVDSNAEGIGPPPASIETTLSERSGPE